jgi:hypothetical protein
MICIRRSGRHVLYYAIDAEIPKLADIWNEFTDRRPNIRRVGWPCEQYANIARAESAQIVLRHPKPSNSQAVSHELLPLIPNHFAGSVGGPEKAGVGGSIPSLATI